MISRSKDVIASNEHLSLRGENIVLNERSLELLLSHTTNLSLREILRNDIVLNERDVFDIVFGEGSL